MTTSENKAFSMRLKEAAGAEGIYSATELARLLGVQTEAVKQWYSGSTRPNGKNLANLCSLLRVRFEWLMYGKNADQESTRAVDYSDPASDFADAVAVLNGMGGLLWARTTDVTQDDAEKIGRAILKATQNAEKAFQTCLQKSKTS
jgi:transcriptional regulator with XRE-family HTH domain